MMGATLSQVFSVLDMLEKAIFEHCNIATAGTKDVKPLLSTPGSEGDDGEVRASGSQVASDSGGPTSGRGSKGQKVAGGIQGKEAADSPATGTATEGDKVFSMSMFSLLKQ
jgi:hypothetical protein